MAYPPLSDDYKLFLRDMSERKEFKILQVPETASIGTLALYGLRLNGAQLFVRNFSNPNTEYPRLFINWQTGVGKSIAAISISQEFIKQYKLRNTLGEKSPTVYIISFTARETIQEDMLKYPEFGFASVQEIEDLRRLRIASQTEGVNSPEAKQLPNYLGVLKRRITDKQRGGYYQFYGYKEFANHLFIITKHGLTNKFDLQHIYNRAHEDFGAALERAIASKYVHINAELLQNLKHGLLIADEIHNVYNIQEKNNYGIAIQYVLDTLGKDAPRAIYMSATPMTGSAAEIVDLLNLLVPLEKPLRREEFFTRATVHNTEDTEVDDGTVSAFVVSHLKDGALDRIAKLSAGRVSFLLDSNVESYPKRIFMGDIVQNVPYLLITQCPMSALHANTLAHERAIAQHISKDFTAIGVQPHTEMQSHVEMQSHIVRGMPANSYTLYDMVFPNPNNPNIGLYKSGETPTTIAQASAEWRQEHEIVLSHDLHTISGNFLKQENLAKYSAKYSALLKAIFAAIKAGPGKIMVYHHRVQMSGVILLQEMLLLNGFADESSMPIDSTICAICGIVRKLHSAEHTYMPARFVIAHSDIDRAVMLRSLMKFNSNANIDGYNYRILLGSRIIREGLNFKAVRHQFICSLPTDYPTLVQVFGRVVRKNSHNELQEIDRNVQVRVFVTTAQGETSPELQRYIDKGREYLVIQEVEKVLRQYAVDSFINFDKIRVVMGTHSSLDTLTYKPIDFGQTTAVTTLTYEAYGYGEREVNLIASICKVLFTQKVWKYDDLWKEILANKVKNVNCNVSMFEEGNYALALRQLMKRPWGDPLSIIVKAGDFFIMSTVDASHTPIIDVESYLTDNMFVRTRTVVKLSEFLKNTKSGQNFAVRLREFENAYLIADAESTIELSLVEYGPAFHYALLKKLIIESDVSSDDDRIKELYRRFKIAITLEDAAHATRIFRGGKNKEPDDIVGYVTTDSVVLYDFTTKQWYNATHADFKIEKRNVENDIIVGFISSHGGVEETNTFMSENVAAKFKLRPSIQRLKTTAIAKKGDIRSIARGAVCETRIRDDLILYLKKLREVVGKLGIRPQSTRGGAVDVTYVAKYDRTAEKRFPSTSEICDAIRLHLLALEEDSRAPANGMQRGLRWLYLFNDRPPSMSNLVGKET